MSVADPSITLSPEIRAAIIWDVPALRRGSPGAQDLLHAFGPPPWHEVPDDGEPLRVAAVGVLAAVRGQLDQALQTWASLISSANAEEQLLGHLLRVWVRLPPNERLADLQKSLDLALSLVGNDDRARICRKIATAAEDSGHLDLARAAAGSALDAADESSEIHRAVRWLLYDLGDREIGAPSFDAFSDDVLTQPWITEQGLTGATEADLNRFKDSITGVWSGTLRIGQTPLDVLNAAQRQADWAGLSVRRDALIRLMCAHILENPRSSVAHVRWAVASWILAGGSDVASVLIRAEPQLDAAFANELLTTITQVPTRINVVPQLAVGIWRVISDEDVDRVLGFLDPGPIDQPMPPEARQVWANLLWRSPPGWQAAWRRLDEMRRLAVISEMLPDVANLVSAGVAEEFIAACDAAPDELVSQVAAPAAAFSLSVGANPRGWIEKATPPGLMELLRWRRDAVPDDLLKRVLSRAKQSVERRRDEALEGRYGIGGGDSLVTIGRIIAALGQPDSSADQLLLSIAGDRRMSADDQLAAFQSLALVHEAGLLPESDFETLRSLKTSPGIQTFGTVQVGALRAAQLYALGGSVTRNEESEVFAGCRSSVEQVRLLSVAAIEAILSSRQGNQGASWTLLSALYDPSDEVLSRGLRVLARNVGAVDAQVCEAAANAVVSAYSGGRHIVRLTSVHAAQALADRLGSERMAGLLEAAAADPSWEVRHQVEG